MAKIKPFSCIRPNEQMASRVAALPYDVYNRQEAKAEVEKEPFSFLKIDRAETQFEDSVNTYDPCVYQKAKEIFQEMLQNGTFMRDKEEGYYIYELIMGEYVQTGIVACASIDDYERNVIKKHEKTREEKEIDRITHVDTLNAQTGPIFLAYRSVEVINSIVLEAKQQKALYRFVANDGVHHNVWKISEKENVELIKKAFEEIDSIYIADGHHRAASAVKVGLKKRAQKENCHGEEAFQYFLSVLFPDDQLHIMSYNRTVKDLNGYGKETFLKKVSESFDIKEKGSTPYTPAQKGSFGMYLDQTWYELVIKQEKRQGKDSVASLDVSLLQDYLLAPILGIEDPRTDNRIDFIGGIRGLEELERRANEDMEVSFSMYPTSIAELFDVADANQLMPPKSTWFEPKLRSGLFIHDIS